MRLGIFELAYTCHTLVEERSKIQIINKNHIIDHQSNSSQIIRTYIKYIKYLKYPEKNLSLPTFTKTNISPFKVTINGPVTRNIDNIINSSSDYYIFPKFNLSHFEQYRKLLLNRKIVSFYQEDEINQSTINSLSILEVGFFNSVKSYKKYVQLKFGNVAIQPIKDYLSPYGYPAHLNKIILNLLYFFNNNLVIDLIGFNFFLEKQIYFYGYRSEKYNSADAFDIKALERFWNFQSFHDLFSDWRLIRDLLKSNLVCVSDEMTPLMKLSERDYFNTLSMLYGLRRGSVI